MSKLAINGAKPLRTDAWPTWPIWDDKEKQNLIKVLDSGKWGYPAWSVTDEFEKQYAAYHEARFGITFNSGTTAIQGALWALGINPGDEVIIPAYTFVATASAVVLMGCTPVFADIEVDSFGLDPQAVAASITSRTKAVIAVHIGGRSCDMTGLRAVCDENNLKLIEDAAQAWGAEWEHQRVGALGDAGIFSFQSSKNITSAEGGIVLTNSAETDEMCRSYANCGRLTGKPRYEHFYMGGNFRISDFQAAILMAQFERYPEQHRKRRENADFLKERMDQIDGIRSINEDDGATVSAYHFYMMKYDMAAFEGISKNLFVQALQKEGILAHPGYTVPLYEQPVFQNRAFGPKGEVYKNSADYTKVFLPETEATSKEEGIWIPQTALLGNFKDMDDIADAFEKVKENVSELKHLEEAK